MSGSRAGSHVRSRGLWCRSRCLGLVAGKHKATGLNVPVSGTVDSPGSPIRWTGSRHDTYCLRESGAVTTESATNWTGDKGYVGADILMPFKKPAHHDLLDWQMELNTQISKIRHVMEQIIANFKTWRITHTDYRRPLATFTTTIAAVVGLHFYRTTPNNPQAGGRTIGRCGSAVRHALEKRLPDTR
jgi:hypothetical protein